MVLSIYRQKFHTREMRENRQKTRIILEYHKSTTAEGSEGGTCPSGTVLEVSPHRLSKQRNWNDILPQYFETLDSGHAVPSCKADRIFA